MTTEEMINILETLYAQYPNAQVTPKLVEVWCGAFGQFNAEMVAKAVQNWMLSDTTGFPPVIGQIRTELVKLAAPFLSLTYEEAKEQNHPIYRQARRRVFGKPQPYNPNADPGALLKSSDVPFRERECKRVFEDLLDKASRLPIPELLTLTVKVTSRIEAAASRKRLEARR